MFNAVLIFLIVICSVVTSFLLDQIFEDPGTFPVSLMFWPPFVFYRIIGILNRHATSHLLPNYTLYMVKPGDPIFIAIIILIVDIVLLILLASYLIQIIPSEFGYARPWHFPISTFLKRNEQENDMASTLERLKSRNQIKDTKEKDLEDADVKEERIKVLTSRYPKDIPLLICEMQKTYINGKVKKNAVKNVTFAVENGIVFGLLGPNGAGKTSLISILTGVYPASSGKAFISGFLLDKHPEYALRSIGVCPQVFRY
jgi:ABC-type multidrug transport system fused ATPase/permease subunit